MKQKKLYQNIESHIKKQFYRLSLPQKEVLSEYFKDYFVQLKTSLHAGEHYRAQEIYNKVANYLSSDKLSWLFSKLIDSDDLITEHSSIFIKKGAIFHQLLLDLKKQLPIHIVEHERGKTSWTRDLFLSLGDTLYHPCMSGKIDPPMRAEYLSKEGQYNPRTPYHFFQNIGIHPALMPFFKNCHNKELSPSEFFQGAKKLSGVSLEGGNLFCAHNNQGKKKYLIGENALIETIVLIGKQNGNFITRKKAKQLFAFYLDVDINDIIFIPQWTYHLDLQMAYLGKGRFIIHSFDQKNFHFFDNLQDKRTQYVKETFDFLYAQLESSGLVASEFKIDDYLSTPEEKIEELVKNILYKADKYNFEIDEKNVRDYVSGLVPEHHRTDFTVSIIDRITAKLAQNGFQVEKVFGCLFYLTDTKDSCQLPYVPYCRNNKFFGGTEAQLMNGLPIEIGDQVYFVTFSCENKDFREQFEQRLQEMGVQVIYLAFNPEDKEFYQDGSFHYECKVGNKLTSFKRPTDLFSFLSGLLRCQTSSISQSFFNETAHQPKKRKRAQSFTEGQFPLKKFS